MTIIALAAIAVLLIISFFFAIRSMALSAELSRLKTYILDLENIHQLPDYFPVKTFEKFLERELERAERYSKEFSLVSFEGVPEDQDEEIATLLRESLRSFDVISIEKGQGHVLLPETGPADVRTIVLRVGKKLNEKYKTTAVHFGIVSYPHDATLMEDMFEKACQARTSAADSGKTVLTFNDIF